MSLVKEVLPVGRTYITGKDWRAMSADFLLETNLFGEVFGDQIFVIRAERVYVRLGVAF